MTRLQSALSKVCRELGLRIIVPFKLSLSQGDVDAKALLPQLGAPKGMLIVTDYLDLKGKEHELPTLGYGYSVLSEPIDETGYDLDGWIEMFSEWGWAADNEPKPDWLQVPEEDNPEWSTLTRLANWYRSHCDKDWEHMYGVRINTLDNPGWSVDISLQETELEEKAYQEINIERSTNDWLQCFLSDGQFRIRCGPLNLEEGLNCFLSWADSENHS